NLIDRAFYGLAYGYAPLFYGKVVDFIDFDIPDINFLGLHLNRFYVFNIADAGVSIGVFLLLFFYPSHKKEAVDEEQPPPLSDENETAPSASEDGPPIV